MTDEKNISFKYKNETISFTGKSDKDIFIKVHVWLYDNNHTWCNFTNNGGNFYTEEEKNEQIKRTKSGSENNFYEVDDNKYILAKLSSDAIKKLVCKNLSKIEATDIVYDDVDVENIIYVKIIQNKKQTKEILYYTLNKNDNMKENVLRIIEDLYELNFNENTFKDKKHEKSVEAILISNGLSEIDKNDPKYSSILKDNKYKMTFVEELKGIFIYISQPFGTQQMPDFIICVDGFIMWLECKSGDNLVWNTGYPKMNILFLYTKKKTNKTILFFGQHSEIASKNENFEIKYQQWDNKVKEFAKNLFSEMFVSDEFSGYARKMLNNNTKYELKRDEFYEKVLETINEKFI